MNTSTITWAARCGLGAWLLLMLAFAMPQQALAQQAACKNIAPSIGLAPAELADACGDATASKGQAVADPANEAFGWESSFDALNSMTLGAPEVLSGLGGTSFGNFVGACDFAGGDSSKLYCLDAGAGAANLWTVATDGSGATTLVGNPAPFGSETFTSLDWDPTTSTMYATSTNITSSSLYTINLTAGTATRVGPTTSGLNCSIAGGFDNSGQLYVFDICSDSMYRVDKGSGAATLLGPLGFDANFGQGMDFDASDNTCYLFAFNLGTFQPELRTCNTATGATTFLGVIGSTAPGGTVQIGGGGVAGDALSDLAITKEVTFDEADKTGSYHVTVSNLGPLDATGVEVLDTLPGSITITNIVASQGVFDPFSGVWLVGDVANGGDASLWIDVTFDAQGRYTNKVEITASDQMDPEPGNDTAEVSIIVLGDRIVPDFVPERSGGGIVDRGARFTADLVLDKTVDSATATVDQEITYTIAVFNQGPQSTANVAVTDHLPECLDYVSSSADRGAYDPGTWIWTVGKLKVGETATLEITVTVTSACNGEVINTAEVTSSSLPDPDDQFNLFDEPPIEDEIDSASINVSTRTVSLDGTTFALGMNYPNPFNPTTVIPFSLAEGTSVTIKVYDLLGRTVATLVDGTLSAGVHEARFEASHLPTGMYIVRMEAGSIVKTQRVTLMK